jgi:hypothetical protein
MTDLTSEEIVDEIDRAMKTIAARFANRKSPDRTPSEPNHDVRTERVLLALPSD